MDGESISKMAKKKTAGSAPAAQAASESPAAAAASRRRRAAAPKPPGVTTTPSTADDRTEPMPEPAGQRVTLPDASTADSVTFDTGAPISPSYEEIAEAAYHRYLSRGGNDGYDFDDWIEAERQLKGR